MSDASCFFVGTEFSGFGVVDGGTFPEASDGRIDLFGRSIEDDEVLFESARS